MKSRKVKATAKSKAFMSKKKLKGSVPLDVSDSGSDVDSESFFHDDIDDFHKHQEMELSTDDELIQHEDQSSEEEEVLPITDDEKEDSDQAFYEKDESDKDDDLPNPEAWGKRKSLYYDADFVDEDRGRTYREEDAEAAKAEAEEAFAIQKSVYSNITADHLGSKLFLEGSESSEDEEEKEDLISATKQEKIKFLKKTTPEMFDFFKDFKFSFIEIQDKFLPLLNFSSKRKLPTEACAEYIKIKYQLLLHLTLNINFYMILKSSTNKTHYHPVLQRINSYKKLLDKLKPIDEAVKNDIEIIVEKLKHKEEIVLNESRNKDTVIENDLLHKRMSSEKSKVDVETKILKRKNLDLEDEKEQIKKRKVEETTDDLDDKYNENQSEVPLEEKRTITYQIAKNKGLIPHRKKEYRNPRVKHRMKFRKAQIRRKGQVRGVIKEVKRYEGEPTGISTHVVKSIKLK